VEQGLKLLSRVFGSWRRQQAHGFPDTSDEEEGTKAKNVKVRFQDEFDGVGEDLQGTCEASIGLGVAKDGEAPGGSAREGPGRRGSCTATSAAAGGSARVGPGRRGSAATSDDAAKEVKKRFLQARQLHWQFQEEFLSGNFGDGKSEKEESHEVLDDVDGSVDFDAPNEGNEVDQQGSFRVQKKEFGAIPPFPTLVADDGVLEGGEGQQPWQFPRLKKKKVGREQA